MKTVHELSDNELNELRDRLYYEYLDSGDLDEVFEGVDIQYSTDIPMDHVKIHYKEYLFTDDDFFCNEKH